MVSTLQKSSDLSSVVPWYSVVTHTVTVRRIAARKRRGVRSEK
jgi:hypothetical protein